MGSPQYATGSFATIALFPVVEGNPILSMTDDEETSQECPLVCRRGYPSTCTESGSSKLRT